MGKCSTCNNPATWTNPLNNFPFCDSCLENTRNDSPELAAMRARMRSAPQLKDMEFPPKAEYIEGMILEGLGILGGKPKLGKSWWAMRAGLTIASGGVAFGNPNRKVAEAPVLYLALEDGQARLQNRLNTLLLPGEEWPGYLMTVTEWPRFDAGGIDMLAELVDTDGYRVVIIDTLARVRKARRGGGDAYQEDSDALAELHDMVRGRQGLAVQIIHHNRKNDDPDDFVDALSGTTGISGVVDHVAVLQRGRGEADGILRFVSRDAGEHDTAFKLDQGMWTELGDAALYAQSQARQSLLYALSEVYGGEATLKDLAEYLDKTPPTVLKQLRGLETEGLVRQTEKGGPWEVANRPNQANWPSDGLAHLAELADSPREEEAPNFGDFGEFGGFSAKGTA